MRLRLLCPKFFLLLALRAFAADPRRRGGDGDSGVWHPHHLLGDAIRLVLRWVIDGAAFKFRLNGEARHRKKRRRSKPLGAARGKDRDFSEIPRRRRLLGGRARGVAFIFVRAWLAPVHARALRQNPEYRLIADAPLEHMHLLHRRVAKPLCRNRRALEFGWLCRWLCDRRSEHACNLLGNATLPQRETLCHWPAMT